MPPVLFDLWLLWRQLTFQILQLGISFFKDHFSLLQECSIVKDKEKYFHLDSRDFRFSAVIIVKNKCIDLLRKEKMYADIAMDELEIFLESNEKPIDEQVIISSEYAAIRKHMASIDEISKQVLIMKYAFGMSYKEIGETLSMTPKHVDTRIFRAKEKVRRLVENESS